MKSVIRIVKRGTAGSNEPLRPENTEEKKAATEREIATTIKSWIADREQRKRSADTANWELLTKFAE